MTCKNNFCYLGQKKLYKNNKKEEVWKQIPVKMMHRLRKNSYCFSSDLSVKYFEDLGLIKNSFWRKVLSCWLLWRKVLSCWLDNKQKWSTTTPAKIVLEKQCHLVQKAGIIFLRLDWFGLLSCPRFSRKWQHHYDSKQSVKKSAINQHDWI